MSRQFGTFPLGYKMSDAEMADECLVHGWQAVPIGPLWFICKVPRGRYRFRIPQFHIGTWSAIRRTFYTSMRSEPAGRYELVHDLTVSSGAAK